MDEITTPPMPKAPEEQRAELARLLEKRLQKPRQAPLSFSQERLWFLDQLEPGNPLLNMAFAVRLSGQLNVIALTDSLNEIVRRHETLRTTFSFIDGRPLQVIAPSLTLELPVIELQDLSVPDPVAAIPRLITEEASRSFDLTRGPLIRATLLRQTTTEHVLVLNMHHIVSDGWSMWVFIRETAALYSAFCEGRPSPLPDLPIQYADFAAWQRQYLQGERLAAQLAYWKDQLAGAPVQLDFPVVCPPAPSQTFRVASYSSQLPESLTEKLRALSRREQATLFMTLLAAFKVLLYRYTGSTDIVVGSVIANRIRAEIEDLIGVFFNALILRTDLTGNPTFCELLKRVRNVTLGAYAHQDLPFEKLVEELHPARDLNRNPLYQAVFNLLDAPTRMIQLPNLTMKALDIATEANMPELFRMGTRDIGRGELVSEISYRADLFNESTIIRLVKNYQTLLESVATNPEQRLSELSVLTKAEQRQILVEWNSTKAKYDERCLPVKFEEQAARTPDVVAVVFSSSESTSDCQYVTYRELNQRANHLAYRLQAAGVGPDKLVGICVERSVEMMIGLLGILKAGGAYVPFDPQYPPERLMHMLTDANISVLLLQPQLAERFTGFPGQRVYLDTEQELDLTGYQQNPISRVLPDNLMYVIYTSGSTGRPKGAGVNHRGFANLLQWFITEFQLTVNDRTLLISSLSFDLTQKNLYAPLLIGGTLHLLPAEHYDPTQIVAAVCDQHITWINCTPSAFYPLAEHGIEGLHMAATLRHVFLGGEPIVLSRLANWLEAAHPHVEIVNTYGPTECTDICAAHRVTWPQLGAERAVPIGKPIYNVQIYVLDQYHKLVPIGAVGELYVGGSGVGRGYLNNLNLTLEKFTPDPFSTESGARLYRTGDLVRYWPDGNIEFVGRSDFQVKVRGFRVELGEIEAILRQHPSIQEAVVVAQMTVAQIDNAAQMADGNQRLIAYVVARLAQSLAKDEIRTWLQQRLPEYMVPAVIVVLGALPVTPSGKVDRKSLAAREEVPVKAPRESVAPETELEQRLAEIWAKVLNYPQINSFDNFFDLGGHSLTAIQVIYEINRVLRMKLMVRDLFQEPTLRGLALLIEERLIEELEREETE